MLCVLKRIVSATTLVFGLVTRDILGGWGVGEDQFTLNYQVLYTPSVENSIFEKSLLDTELQMKVIFSCSNIII